MRLLRQIRFVANLLSLRWFASRKKRAGFEPAPTLSFFAYFAAKSFSLVSRAAYLNSGSTFSANKRIFFIAISCGMPPK